jgi:hypothetical protein
MPLELSHRFPAQDYLHRLHKLREWQLGFTQEEDIVTKFRGDELGFMTQGLNQYQEDSWSNWRAILKAAFGKPLNADELEFFHEVAGNREPPPGRVKELWIVGGRRGGKDSIAAGIATQVACYADEGMVLRPGERALVACFATDRDQAGIVYSYIKGYFDGIPSLRRKVVGEIPSSYSAPINLDNRTEIRVVTNNFRAPRGRPIPVAIFDEVAFWRDEKSATPDTETYNAITPAMATIPHAMIIAISSAYRQKGLLYNKWEEHYGKDDDQVLVIQATTRQLRPTFPQSVIDAELAKDHESASAEYLSQWRRDLADFVSREVILGLVVDDRISLPPVRGIVYSAFVDPSGGAADSFTLAIAHPEGDVGVLDFILEIRAPFQPSEAVEEICRHLSMYRIMSVRGDRYAGDWPAEQFRKHGVTYEQSEFNKSDIYLNALPMFNSHRIELLDSNRLIEQLCRLERRTSRGGKQSIDHPRNENDDVANAACGALLMVTLVPDEISRWVKAFG